MAPGLLVFEMPPFGFCENKLLRMIGPNRTYLFSAMHRFQSKSTIIRFRFASLLLCLKCLLAPAAAGLLAYSIFKHDMTLTWIAIGLGCATLFALILQWIVAARTRCPLCLTPVLATKGCSKHRNAKTFLGSYRLRVSLAVLFKGAFRCPYCNEPSAMEVRNRRGEAGAQQLHARIRQR